MPLQNFCLRGENVNKKIYMRIIVVLVCLVLITDTYTIYHYQSEYSPDEWFRESIQDGDYVIVGDEIGNTIFGGQTQVEISMFSHVDAAQHMTTFKTTIRNRGKKLTADNYCIEHNDEYIKIILIDSDGQRRVAYRFFFKDFKH